MKVYKCLITGDELFTDIYPQTEENGLIKLKGKHVTRPKGTQVDDSMIGGNASAEDPTESSDGGVEMESGTNIVLDNRLTSTGFGTKKEYTAYFKDFVKKLREIKLADNPDIDIKSWEQGITGSFKAAVANFKDYEFYTGVSGDPDGNIVLLRWETPEGETDEVPFCYLFRDGLKEEKC